MSTRRAPRLPRVGWETAGILLSAAAAVVALAHALAGAKRSLLLDDGDSVLLPLMQRSFERGEAFEWGMSPVLFVFPELPLYLTSAAVTISVAAALLLNGVVNVVALYALLRFLAGRVLATRSLAAPGQEGAAAGATDPRRPILAALLGVAVLVALCLLETRPGGNTLEIASLFLTTTYYSGTVMALVATLGLVVHLAGPLDGRGRRILLPALTIGIVAAVSTLSNPLFVLWVTGPVVAALLVLSLVRWRTRIRDPWWRPAATALALVAGSAAGYAARQPFSGRFIIAEKDEYFRWGREDLTLSFARESLRALVETPGGVVEALVGAALLVGSVVVAAAVVARRSSGPMALVALVAGATAILLPLALLVTGSISTRYALPLLFTPLALVVAALAVTPRPAPRPARARDRRRIAVAAPLAVLLVVAGAAVPATAAVARAGDAVASASASGAACLTAWTRGKHVTGVAQFWTGRRLAAYGGPSVRLLQVNSDFTVYPWLVDLAPYRDARVGYVIVATRTDAGGHLDYWGDDVTNLGTPRGIVHCDGYDIRDYRGLPASSVLTEQVDRSAAEQAARRGFGW
ncbi:hypothetical protein [Frondihabitans peucedani]|uniref:4-amino-4-deoxy-L-arabinose transferase-like glycosyltransferase n=1 Tax=Frondihabitans peucedani TaxID=598626 RepID=A0ABP8DZJ0_9MICO